MKSMNPGAAVLGYARVSTAEQADNGYGLAAQEAVIRQECERRGWTLLDVVRDEGASGEAFRSKLLAVYPDGLQGRSVLDCGCNCGECLFWAKELGAGDCFGFDAREHWIKDGSSPSTANSPQMG